MKKKGLSVAFANDRYCTEYWNVPGYYEWCTPRTGRISQPSHSNPRATTKREIAS